MAKSKSNHTGSTSQKRGAPPPEVPEELESHEQVTGEHEVQQDDDGRADWPREARQEVERLEQELAAARKRVDELARGVQGLQQEQEAFQRRLTRERQQMIDIEKGKVATALLEGIDELDRCLSASGDDGSPLAQGVRLIRQSLLDRAMETGLERIRVEGLPFDPNTAEAVDMEITPREEDDGAVISEVRAGYRMGERIIRPARVKVARFVKPAEA